LYFKLLVNVYEKIGKFKLIKKKKKNRNTVC